VNSRTTIFVIGFAVGAYVFWHVSIAVERFRRARDDFRATRRGLRTLIEMMARRGWDAVKGVSTAIVLIALVALFWRYYR
jgi:hypothetical protein